MRSKVTVISFILLLFIFFSLIVFLPKDEKASVLENRALREMPTLSRENIFSGIFSSEFEDYLSDNVAFRSIFTDLSSKYDTFKGIERYGKIVQTSGDLGVGETTKGQLLVIDSSVMEIYNKDEKARENYISMLDFYAKNLPENTNLYSMLIPTRIAFNKYNVGDDEIESINYIYKNSDKRIKNINLVDTLNKHYKNNEYIFFNTDHHWTALGAFYAYNKIADDISLPELNIEDFWVGKQSNFLGHLYAQAKTPSLKNASDNIFYYINDINNIEMKPVTYSYKGKMGERFEYDGKIFCPEKGPSYELFLAGDHPFIEINSACENKRTLLLIKDSYSNALIPWLVCGYNQVLVVDARTFDRKIEDILKEYKVDDIIIENYIMATNFNDFTNLLKEIYK